MLFYFTLYSSKNPEKIYQCLQKYWLKNVMFDVFFKIRNKNDY